MSRSTLLVLPLSLLLMLLILHAPSVSALSLSLSLSLAPGDPPLSLLEMAPIIRHNENDRGKVIDMQWMVQTDSNASTTRILDALGEALDALTQPILGGLQPLPHTVKLSFRTLFRYDTALTGFALKFEVINLLGALLPLPLGWTNDAVVELGVQLLASTAGVMMIEEDAKVEVTGDVMQYQSTSQWNLDRVDQRQLNGDDRYYYNGTGSSSHVYVLDTGIHKSHQDFGGRADWKFSAFNPYVSNPNCEDGQGHGTHVAGIVGGATYGLAKQVRLHAIKVLDDDGAGSDSSVVAGIDWVCKNRVMPAVAVMSLGGPASSTLDTAVKNMVRQGIVAVVAAGNANVDACNVSPARVDIAITVGAQDGSDNRASFSNYGSCVTLFAPGLSIVSASNMDDTSGRTLSGTSMSAPHVAGAVAVYLSRNPTATPDQVKADLICYSTKDALSNVQGSPNRILYSIIKGGAPLDTGLPVGSVPLGSSGGDASGAPSGNNQNEQCTSSSPCQGPFTATLSSSNAVRLFSYNTTSGGGFHRAWLNYNTGGGTLLNPQSVQNTLSLLKFDSASDKWLTVATATDSNNAKSIMYEDSEGSASSPGSSWSWAVQAKGYTPSQFTLSYKTPSAVPAPEPSPDPTLVDQCSATSTFDPDPNSPNNVGRGAATSTARSSDVWMMVAIIGAVLYART